jgi:hypothetical protein
MLNGIILPEDSSDTWHGILLFQCGKLFGEEFGAFCDRELRKLDENWLANLKSLRQEFNINLNDPSFLFKEALLSDSPFRKILPKNLTFYNEISILKRIRNKNQHYEFDGGVNEVKSAIKLFFDISLELKLSRCTSEFSKLLNRIDEIQAGKAFKNYEGLAEKLEVLQLEKAEIYEKLIDQNAVIEKTRNDIERTQKLIDERNSEIERLQKINSEKDSTQTEILSSVAELKKEIFNLEDQLQEQTSLASFNRVTESEVEAIISILMDRMDNKLKVTNNDSQVQDFGVRNPWNKPKGKTKITLSVGKKDLLDPKTKEPLDYIEENRRTELAKKWLKIRPTGGRVFLDDDGNVTTVIDEDLIFLDKIEVGSNDVN